MSEKRDAYDRSFNKSENLTPERGQTLPKMVYHLVSEIFVRHIHGTYLLM